MYRLFAILLFILTTHAFAMFCPTNFKSIDIGDTLEKVQQDCGNPTSLNHYTVGAGAAQEWSYFVKTRADDDSTAKMTVVFKDEKVININIDDGNKIIADNCDAILAAGINSALIQTACNKSFKNHGNVSATEVCGRPIRIGDDAPTIEAACGKPVAINALQQGAQGPTIQMTELKYDGPNPATLIFENGILKERKA